MSDEREMMKGEVKPGAGISVLLSGGGTPGLMSPSNGGIAANSIYSIHAFTTCILRRDLGGSAPSSLLIPVPGRNV